MPHHRLSFNPHPTSRLDAASGGGMGLRFAQGRVCVSILIQPLGWAQQGGLSYLDQSKGFNPHPTSWLGATSQSFQLSRVEVSILTQPIGWVQRLTRYGPRSVGVFQSSPNLLAGCNQRADPHTVIHRSFNPHLTSRLGAGCRSAGVCRSGTRLCFNPHRISRLGAASSGRALLFQSSPNLSAGCSWSPGQWS